jgi:predicted dehydrogenase
MGGRMRQHSATAASFDADFNRRDFLRGASFATVATMMGGVPILAADTPAAASEEKKSKKPPVKCGVIGLGLQGRELLTALSLLPNAPVVALCDTYEAMVNRAKKLAPDAQTYTDYKELLANKDVKAVLIATPTHKHREIAEAALAAGKHVYCEAPLAYSLEDARAIAQAARKAARYNFQPGLQRRADPQQPFTLKFIRAGAAGNLVKARAQWAKKNSWRRSAPSPEREKELNWRLYHATSLGLVGEEGIHQVDLVAWFLKARPKSVTGFGSLQFWSKDNDDREVADTVQAVFEFPNKVNFFYDASLANSFESEYEVFYGSDAAVVLRGASAWMFKEADAPLLGWEVYCRKDEGVAYKEAGLSMRADATKIKAQGKQADDQPYQKTALASAMEAFIANTNTLSAAMEDFEMMGGDFKDEKALREYLQGDSLKKAHIEAPGWQEGYEATVLAMKANESIVKGQKIVFSDEWFQV